MIVRAYNHMVATVNPANPNFSGYTKIKHNYTEKWAIVSDGVKQWRESFKISAEYDSKVQVKEVIQFFNDTRLPDIKERERTFVEFYTETENVAQYGDDIGMTGWLDPSGVFHPCSFGEHVSYALSLFRNGEIEEWVGGKTEMEQISHNQHIPMSTWDQSSQGYITILGRITGKQVDWFNDFFFKLCPRTQRNTVVQKAKEQGIQLKYDW